MKKIFQGLRYPGCPFSLCLFRQKGQGIGRSGKLAGPFSFVFHFLLENGGQTFLLFFGQPTSFLERTLELFDHQFDYTIDRLRLRQRLIEIPQ